MTLLYRQIDNQQYVDIGHTNIPCNLKNKKVFLVTDSIETGALVRAALNVLSDYEEPQLVVTVTLIDQKQLIYPIYSQFIGKGNANRVIWKTNNQMV